MTLNMIYSLSFLALFAITVFVTLMGAAKIRPFHNMPDKVVKILVGSIVVELAVAVIGVYKSFNENPVKRYRFVVHYGDFLDSWIANLGEEDRRCLQEYRLTDQKLTDLISKCREVAEAYERKQDANKTTGRGYLYLYRGDNSYEGLAIYRFSDKEAPTIMEVSGQDAANRSIRLSFIQQESVFKRKDGVVLIRPYATFEPTPFIYKTTGGADRHEARLLDKDGIDHGIVEFYLE